MDKEKNKIVIVSREFYPVNSPRAFRTTELVKEFSRQGHEVTLLTTKKPSYHDSFEREYGVIIKDFGSLKFKTINWEKKSSLLNLFQRVLNRSMQIFFEYPDIELLFKIRKALLKESGYDLLISVAAPHATHWGVSWAMGKKRKMAKTWVADCGDPFMGGSMDAFKKPFYFKFFEKSFCQKADYISVPTDGAKEAYYEEFRNKIKVIPQGFKFEDTEKLLEPYKENPCPTFAYAGSFSPGRRDPGPILDFLAKQEGDFRFYVFTNMPSLFEPYKDQLQNRLIVNPFVPREKLLGFLSKMDFLINLENSVTTQTPSKLIDYYLCKRPVLSMNSTNFNEKPLFEFLQGNYEKKLRFIQPDDYRIENIVKSFLNLLKK